MCDVRGMIAFTWHGRVAPSRMKYIFDTEEVTQELTGSFYCHKVWFRGLKRHSLSVTIYFWNDCLLRGDICSQLLLFVPVQWRKFPSVPVVTLRQLGHFLYRVDFVKVVMMTDPLLSQTWFHRFCKLIHMH